MKGIKLQQQGDKFWFVYAGRFDFHADTIKYFQERGKDTDICHRVSFKVMASALINALNFFLANVYAGTPRSEELAGETIHYVRGIISAVVGVYPNNTKGKSWVEELRDLFDTDNPYRPYLIFIEDMLRKDGDLMQIMLCVESCLNHILDLMNNEKYNLKRGDRSTNRSIGEGFDAFDNLSICYEGFILGPNDSNVMTMLVEATKGGGSNFDQSGVFVYTSEENGLFVYESSIGALKPEMEKATIQEVYYFNYIQGQFVQMQADR